MFRRRNREPPSTGSHNFARRRQPIDPPTSFQASVGPRDPEILQTTQVEPAIQLTSRQLEILHQRTAAEASGGHPPAPTPQDPSEVGARTFSQLAAARETEKKTLVSDDDFLAEFEPRFQENNAYSNPLPSHDENESAGPSSSKVADRSLTSKSSSGSHTMAQQQIPFTTRSNTNLSLASRRQNKDKRPMTAARSSVFRKKNSSDAGTVVSVNSHKSVATTASHHLRTASGSTVSAATSGVSDHDKAALRKLLGTGPSSGKPSITAAAAASTATINKKKPQSAKPAAITTAPSTDEPFDQREYLRNLIHQKSGAPKARGSKETNNSTVKSSSAAPSSSSATHAVKKGKYGRGEKTRDSGSNVPITATSSGVGSAIKTKSGYSSSSSASIDQKAMLRILTKTALKTSKDKAKKRILSPRSSKRSKSPKGVSSPNNKGVSPKRGIGFKGYVRKRMGFSKKRDSSISPKSTKAEYDDVKLANSLSTDSGAPSMSQVASMSTDTAVDNRTRTTLASSSNLSDDCTKQSYDSSLKQLSTAATLDTDTSSTIMGNLQSASTLRSASSDSMQYSSEEGCDNNSVVGTTAAFKTIDKITASSAPYSRGVSGSFTHHQVTPVARRCNKTQHLVAGGSSKLIRAYPSDNQGYNTFLKALQLEASEAHSQLWSSFQSVMTGSPKRFPPKLERNAQFKFDSPTKKMLAVMNLHLKRQALVECASEAQLVNDKEFAKEVEKDLSLRKSSVGADSKSYKPMGVINENSPAENIEKHQSNSTLPPSLGVTTGSASIDTDEAAPQNHQGFNSSGAKHELRESLEKVKDATKKPQFAVQKGRLENKSRPQIASVPESKTTLATALAAVKLSKTTTSAGSRHHVQPSNTSDTDASIPWSGVQLRSVSNVDASSDSQDEVAPQSAKQNTMPSPWKRVKLRRIPDEEKGPMERAEAEQHRMQQNDSLDAEDTEVDGVLTSVLLPIPEEFPAGSSKTRTVTPDQIVDEQKYNLSTPEEDLVDIDESAVVLELKNTRGESEHEKVAVDKKMVVLLQSTPGNSKEAVTWSLRRDSIKSLKLDMGSQRVNLSLVDGNEPKTLSFNNSTDCLKFANAFYEMLKPSEQRESEQVFEDTIDKKGSLEELNDEEQQVLESYRQARRTRAPGDAMRTVVRASDPKTTVHESLLGSVLSDRTSGGSAHDAKMTPSSLPEEEMKIVKSYEKMIKMGIPLDAVQHRMTKDGVDSKIVDFVLGLAGNLVTNTGSSDEKNVRDQDTTMERKTAAVKIESNLDDAEEEIAAPYRKMLKMMIPKEAVHHKMMKDQLDPRIVAAVFGESATKKEEPMLTPSEEATAATYRKMLKLQMPRDAIKHKMEKEQVSEKVIRVVLGIKVGDTSTAPATRLKPSEASKRASKLVSLHWTPLSGKELDNSVWRAAKKSKVATTQPEGSDISTLVELFQKKSTVKTAKGKGGDGSDNGVGKAKLIDLNRANIIAISLKAFKDFTYDDLADILLHVDPNHKLHGERVQFVRDLLPTATEISAVKRFYGSLDRLVPAERWFKKIVHIKRLEAKAHVLHTMEVFESEVAEIQESLNVLTRVCNQVMESERLRELLDMILQIGNIMNEGTRTGGASGFKFDSLLRLTQTKSGDGKTTVLDYMVTIYVAKDQKHMLDLMEDFPDCQVASRTLISDLVTNVKDIHGKMLKCKKEYESLVTEEETAKSGIGGLKKTPGMSTGAISDPRLQLLSAITAKADPGEISSETAGPPYNKPVDVLSYQKLANSAAGKDGQSNKTSGQQAGIAKLNGFLENADRTYKKLKSDCDLAVETCREMAQYCGEGGGERSTDALLGVLSEFAANLEAAVQKRERTMVVEAKKQSRQAAPVSPKKPPQRLEDMPVESSPSKKTCSPSPPSAQNNNVGTGDGSKETKETKPAPKPRPSPESIPRGKGTSLVLMVNELLKDSSDEAKKDFSQGVVYENPDDKLKAIYDREMRTGRKGMPPLPRRSSVDGDLMSAIRKRQGESDGLAAKAKRSQLERVIDCINCASGATDTESVSTATESETALSTVSDHPADKFKDLQSKWKGQLVRSVSNRSLGSQMLSEDEGSVCNPIDCSDIDDGSESSSYNTSQGR